MKKGLCIAAIWIVAAAAGLGSGYLTKTRGQNQEEEITEAPALLELGKTDEEIGYKIPEKKIKETEAPEKSGEWLLQDDGSYFYKNAEGNYLTGGWEEIDDAWYYFDENGTMATGWMKKDGTYFYLDTDGRMRTGWMKENGAWYYLNEDGSLLTNEQTPDGYDVNSDGALYYKG